MELLFIRHADAGSKSEWTGDDRLRPLSATGRDEAKAVVDVLVAYEPVRIISSPLLRCIETVAPLSQKLGLPIEESEYLEPEAGEGAVALAHELAASRGPVVVCTHRETLEVLERGLVGRRSAVPQSKGSLWVVQAANGRFRSAHYFSPPGLAIQRHVGYTDRSRVE